MEHSYRSSAAALAGGETMNPWGQASPAPARLAQSVLALSMVALGVLGLIYGDVALVWQHLPIEHMAGARIIAYAFALIELAAGVGLLLQSTATPASILLVVFLLVWLLLLKLPAVVAVPSMEATWLGFGEIAVIFAGAWIVFAFQLGERSGGLRHVSGGRGVRAARVLFALSLPMIGLSHFIYSAQTVPLVPAWLPYPLGWAYFTGACSIAACAAVLLNVLPQLAARLEAAMLAIITVLVWLPAIIAAPGDRTAWTALVISAAIASGAWVVAESYGRYAGRSA